MVNMIEAPKGTGLETLLELDGETFGTINIENHPYIPMNLRVRISFLKIFGTMSMLF